MKDQEEWYLQARSEFGPALGRLAAACEANPDLRRDLLQEIHLALWRSFRTFDARCSLRTWVYRVAHNVAASHVLSSRRSPARNGLSLDDLDTMNRVPSTGDPNPAHERRQLLDRLYALIRSLNPLDQQVILQYLEGADAASIGEITGISPGHVATKIHRIKAILADRHQKETHRA